MGKYHRQEKITNIGKEIMARSQIVSEHLNIPIRKFVSLTLLINNHCSINTKMSQS